MDTLITYGIGAIICFFFLMIYLRSLKKRETRAREAAEKGSCFPTDPRRSIRKSTTTSALAALPAPASVLKATC